jgi:hypothetical protein
VGLCITSLPLLSLLAVVPREVRANESHVWCEKPCARIGDSIRFGAWVTNSGDRETRDVAVEFKASNGVKPRQPVRKIDRLPSGW